MCVIIYLCIAAMMFAILTKIYPSTKWRGDEIPTNYTGQVFASLFWPFTAPAFLCYKLVNKALDKILKV